MSCAPRQGRGEMKRLLVPTAAPAAAVLVFAVVNATAGSSRAKGRWLDPRVYANKHLVIPIHRPVDLPEFQDVRRAVPVLDDCLHRLSSSMHSIISCCFDPSLQRGWWSRFKHSRKGDVGPRDSVQRL